MKKWLLKHLFFSNGEFRKVKQCWFIKNGYQKQYDLIMAQTSLLKNPTFKERVYCILNDIKQVPICKNINCDNKVKFHQPGRKAHYREFCSHKCARNSEEWKKKYQETCLKRYGVNNVMKNQSIQQQKEITCLKKYGVKNVSQNEIIKKKIQQTHQQKYGCYYVQQNLPSQLLDKKWLIKEYQTQTTGQIGKKIKCSATTVLHYLKKYGIDVSSRNSNTSSIETEITEFLQSLDPKIQIIQNSKKYITPYEIDIFLPQYKLGIEYHGLYWHSFNRKETVTEKEYHTIKAEIAEQNQISLLQIFEHEWNNPSQQAIWKAIIKNRLKIDVTKIYARKCTIKEILNRQIVQHFLNQNHLQSFNNMYKIATGLFYNDQLVSIMTFGKSRFTKKFEWELNRYCTKLNSQIVGGASKLFSYFTKNYNPQSIVSYSNYRYSYGDIYIKLGFNFIRISKPNYFYYKGTKIFSRIVAQKHKLPSLVSNFNVDLTEYANMFNNGFRRVWDCSNKVWVWESN